MNHQARAQRDEHGHPSDPNDPRARQTQEQSRVKVVKEFATLGVSKGDEIPGGGVNRLT
jgi:hypothetical protein